MGKSLDALPAELFGLYELDDQGIVKYSKGHMDHPLIGQDFFELAPIQNRDDLRRQFRRFVGGHRASDSFTFDCFVNEAVVRARVSMTRAFQTEYFPPEKIVMVDIRESSC
jgi:hypothetical protein